MESVGAYEAKTHLASLLDRVERGETVVITKHGREVARLVPPESATPNTGDVIAELRAGRIGVRRGSISVRQMIEEGRR